MQAILYALLRKAVQRLLIRIIRILAEEITMENNILYYVFRCFLMQLIYINIENGNIIK